MYIYIYVCTYIHIYLWVISKNNCPFLRLVVSTEQLLNNSSTWLSEHRCLLYRWRSWLYHKFCPGAENKPTFSKLPSRAFFCYSALPPGVLLLWLERIQRYQHSSRWEIAILRAIRPRALVQIETQEQTDQVFPSFLLHGIGIWSGHSILGSFCVQE